MRLELGDQAWELTARPVLMGIVNANPDSVADAAPLRTLEAQVARAREMVAAGAAIVDVGGESGRTDQNPRSAEAERELVVPLVRALAEQGITVSVDTWKLEVARAAVEAGARLINDVSGLADEGIAELAAQTGAGLVLMHTRAAPKRERFPGYDDVVADVVVMLTEKIERALSLGVRAEQLVLDPGLDFAKTPQESVEVLRRLGEVVALGRPVLLAVSRKYFVGVATARRPTERLAGTLAAVGAGVDVGAGILRVHDVEAVADYLAVRAALSGEADPLVDDSGDDRLRWVPLERSAEG